MVCSCKLWCKFKTLLNIHYIQSILVTVMQQSVGQVNKQHHCKCCSISYRSDHSEELSQKSCLKASALSSG